MYIHTVCAGALHNLSIRTRGTRGASYTVKGSREASRDQLDSPRILSAIALSFHKLYTAVL